MLPSSATSFEVGLDLVSDILTAIAYFSIPLELLYFLKHYPTTIPNKYKSLVIMFALFIILCGLTHAFNALRFGVAVMLCTKWSTALISLVTAAALFVLIPGVLDFLSYAKALEEEVLVEPEPSASPEVKAYLNRRRATLSPRWTSVVDQVISKNKAASRRNLVDIWSRTDKNNSLS